MGAVNCARAFVTCCCCCRCCCCRWKCTVCDVDVCLVCAFSCHDHAPQAADTTTTTPSLAPKSPPVRGAGAQPTSPAVGPQSPTRSPSPLALPAQPSPSKVGLKPGSVDHDAAEAVMGSSLLSSLPRRDSVFSRLRRPTAGGTNSPLSAGAKHRPSRFLSPLHAGLVSQAARGTHLRVDTSESSGHESPVGYVGTPIRGARRSRARTISRGSADNTVDSATSALMAEATAAIQPSSRFTADGAGAASPLGTERSYSLAVDRTPSGSQHVGDRKQRRRRSVGADAGRHRLGSHLQRLGLAAQPSACGCARHTCKAMGFQEIFKFKPNPEPVATVKLAVQDVEEEAGGAAIIRQEVRQRVSELSSVVKRAAPSPASPLRSPPGPPPRAPSRSPSRSGTPQSSPVPSPRRAAAAVQDSFLADLVCGCVVRVAFVHGVV